LAHRAIRVILFPMSKKKKQNKRNYVISSRLRRIKIRSWYDAIMKDQRCAHCGNSDTRVLEWHHLDPDKKDLSIARMLSRRSYSSILAEIQKCICLCANCHRILHACEKGKIRHNKWTGPSLDI